MAGQFLVVQLALSSQLPFTFWFEPVQYDNIHLKMCNLTPPITSVTIGIILHCIHQEIQLTMLLLHKGCPNFRAQLYLSFPVECIEAEVYWGRCVDKIMFDYGNELMYHVAKVLWRSAEKHEHLFMQSQFRLCTEQVSHRI